MIAFRRLEGEKASILMIPRILSGTTADNLFESDQQKNRCHEMHNPRNLVEKRLAGLRAPMSNEKDGDDDSQAVANDGQREHEGGQDERGPQ